MQRILIRYQRHEAGNAFSQNDLRGILLNAAQQACLPLEEGRRAVLMGPPLPSEATSEAEYALFSLLEPWEPSEVARRLTMHLPEGIHLESAWIAHPNCPDEKPAALDEAVYLVGWTGAEDSKNIIAAIRNFYATPEVIFTRMRENKIQQINARNLVRHITLLATQDGIARLRMTLTVGPQGTIRPSEVLQALGFTPTPEQLRVHRIALYASAWQKPGFGNARLQYT